jgi:DNA-binding MarR family transcriptional regulator
MSDLMINRSQDLSCACAALRRAARSATQLYDLVLQPSGLKATQFIALWNIHHSGELEQWRFARQHAVAVETLSRRLAVLRRKGLVSSRIGKNHGERIYSLTDQGREALRLAMPYWERAQTRLKQTLGDADFSLLLQLCENAVTAAQQAERLRAHNSAAISVEVTTQA